MGESNDTMPYEPKSSGSIKQPCEGSLCDNIHLLMTSQPYAVLCTQGAGQPYGSVIAFAVNSQLNAAVFATHKYRLLTECDQVALVIDNRADEHAVDDLGVYPGFPTNFPTILRKCNNLNLYVNTGFIPSVD